MRVLLGSAYVALSLLVDLSSCSSSAQKRVQETGGEAPVQHASASARVAQPQKSRVMRKQGWEIPGLKEGALVRSGSTTRAAAGDSVQINSRWYRPQQEVLIDPALLTPEERAALRLGPELWSVDSLVGYDVDGYRFYYMVLVHPRGVGAITGLHFYDEDGDGAFEAAERGDVRYGPFAGPIPEWVMRRRPGG